MFIVNFLLLFVVIRKGFEQRSHCSKPLIPGKFYDWDIFDSSNNLDFLHTFLQHTTALYFRSKTPLLL